MELAVAAPSAAAFKDPKAGLQLAVREFQNVLTEEQRRKLGKIGVAREAETVMIFTAQLDRENQLKKGRGIASRLYTVLQSVQSFAAVVDTFVSSHPEIAALVWGSVKLTLLIVVNFTSHFEALSGVFMGFSRQCPRFVEYQALYPASPRLQTALCNFHASIIRCCKHAVEMAQRPWQQKLKKAIMQSFEQELQSDVLEIQQLGHEVKAEIALAAATAERQDQKLQALDRESASKSRSMLQSFIPKAERGLDELKAMHLQQSTRKSRNEKVRLLEWLSSHDHRTPFGEACKKRQCDTAEWILELPAFKRWHEGNDASLFWCSGKIGSGKTVLCAHVVNHIFLSKSRSDHASFFFMHHDNAASLRAETAIRSIIRQSLDRLPLSKYIENQLKDLNQSPYINLKTWVGWLQYIIQLCGVYFIFIDGLDECNAVERRAILDALESLTAVASNLRIFLTSRESLRLDLQGRSFPMQHVSMGCESVTEDIRAYVDTSIQERLQQKDLILGDRHLLAEITNTLSNYADGMFLWVTFLLDEICAGSCDADIRHAMENLPKSLEDTYTRILSRISFHNRRVELIQRIFRWVVVAKRPMSLEELREAVATEIGQQNQREELLPHDISRAVLLCGNLLEIVEEEPRQVRFAHGSIHDFITMVPSSRRLPGFHVDFKGANHLCGELCVTYLHFSNFNTWITRQQEQRDRHAVLQLGRATTRRGQHKPVYLHPVDQASTTLSRELKLANLAPVSNTLAKLTAKHRIATPDLVTAAACYGATDTADIKGFQNSNPFLGYAAAHWLSHTVDFRREESKTWDLFLRIVTDGSIPASRPWEAPPYESSLLSWSQITGHCALLRHAINTDPEAGRTALQTACDLGDVKIVERLLIAGAEFTDQDTRQTILQTACEHGHVELVELMITDGADINAGIDTGQTALWVACYNGRIDIVKLLLAAGADANAQYKGHTALWAASLGGHHETKELLLKAGANIET